MKGDCQGFAKCVLFLVPVVALFLTGCAQTGGLKNVDQQTYSAKPQGQSLVIGRLDVRNPKEMGIRMPSLFPQRTFLLTRVSPASSGSENLFHRVERDGYFYLLLDPGVYRISQISSSLATLGRSGEVVFGTDLPFEVPEGKVIYIGDITVEYKLTRLNQVKDRTITVSDNFDEAAKTLPEKFPFVTMGVENLAVKGE
jgi:hypothetical protein